MLFWGWEMWITESYLISKPRFTNLYMHSHEATLIEHNVQLKKKNDIKSGWRVLVKLYFRKLETRVWGMHYHKALLHVKINKCHESSHLLKHLDTVDCVDQFRVNCFALPSLFDSFVYIMTIPFSFPFSPSKPTYIPLVDLSQIHKLFFIICCYIHIYAYIHTKFLYTWTYNA